MRLNFVHRLLSHLSPSLTTLIGFLVVMLITLPILRTDSTVLGAMDNAPDVAAITCYGRDIIDPVSPDFGSLAFVTNYFPTVIDTYYQDGLYETVSSHWYIAETGLVWTQTGDSATLKGEVINNANTGQRIAISFTFYPRYNWTQWSAQGRTYHPKGWSLPHETWDYWILDEGTLEGKGTLSGLLSAFHLPTDHYEGFQVGNDTLPRNSGLSLSGWFGASGALNGESVSTDAYGYLYMLLDCGTGTTPTTTPTPSSTLDATQNTAQTPTPTPSDSSTVCQANSYVDSVVPQYGNLALGTNYLPAFVQTYYDAEYKLFTASSHWNIYGDGITWTVTQGKFGNLAKLQGEVANNYNGDQRLTIDFTFQNKYTWAEWSALGRTADPLDSDLPYETWDYWELTEGTMTGQGALSGTIYVTHRPANYVTGFQVGSNTLIRNPDYAISGWYNMSGSLNGQQINGTYAYGTLYMLLICPTAEQITPTHTSIPTATWTPRPTATLVPTNLPLTVTLSNTSIPSDVITPMPTPTMTPTATATMISVVTSTMIPTETHTPLATDGPIQNPTTPTLSATPTEISTNEVTVTATMTVPVTMTTTMTATVPPTLTPTITDTPDPNATATPIIFSVGNRVWLDSDNNGLLDDGESGIRDVIVRLRGDSDSDGIYETVLQTTATNALGYYLFTGLAEGLYQIEVEPPLGLGSSAGGASSPAPDPDLDMDDSDDNGNQFGELVRSEPIELKAGEEPTGEDNKPGQLDPAADENSNLTVDFGLYDLSGSIGDRVWRDVNENGLQDGEEPGVSGVVVNLWIYDDETGSLETKLATNTTDENGNYRFENLDTALTYVIEIELGAEQFLTKPDVDGNDEIDNDLKYTNEGSNRGVTGPIILQPGEQNDSVDAGIAIYKKTPVGSATPAATSTPTFTSVPTNTPLSTATAGPTPTATSTSLPIAGPERSDDFTIRIDDYVAAPGDTVTVMVEGFNLEGLGTTTMEFHFDPAVLSPVECNKDPDSQFNLFQCNIAYAEDAIRFNVTSMRGVSGDVRFAEITFEVIGENSDISPIDLQIITFANSMGEVLEHTVRNGALTVSTTRRGDVNCNGKRDVIDALMIIQHELDNREATYGCDGEVPREANSIYMPSCDINGDENCDSLDSMLVLQCEVGTSNSLCDRGLPTTSSNNDAVTDVDAAGTLTMYRIPPGSTEAVKLPVTAALIKKDLHAAVIDVHYDPTVLRPVECTTDNLDQQADRTLALCNIAFEADGQGNDLIRFDMISVDGLEAINELFEVTFEVIGDLQSVDAILLKPIVFTDKDGDILPVAVNYIDDAQLEVQNLFRSTEKIFLPLVQH